MQKGVAICFIMKLKMKKPMNLFLSIVLWFTIPRLKPWIIRCNFLLSSSEALTQKFIWGKTQPTISIVGNRTETNNKNRFNGLKKEKASDGNKDESVFNIQQSVAVCFMMKNKK